MHGLLMYKNQRKNVAHVMSLHVLVIDSLYIQAGVKSLSQYYHCVSFLLIFISHP